jgi:hypothetical protein
MPQLNTYPPIASLQDSDLFLVWDASSSSVKTVDFGDVQTNIDIANTTGTLPLARGGLGTSLIAPGADRILFWDQSEGKFNYLIAGTNLNISGNTISATGAGGGSFAPDAANYITKTVNGALPNAQALSSLSTGIVKNTTGTGTLSIAVAGSDFVGIGAVTTSGLTASTNSRLIGRKTAGAGALEQVTTSEVLDFIGTTQGTILYRNATSWTTLSPGTSGQLLKTNGAGADPSWTSGSTGDVVGPVSSTNNGIPRYNGTTGKLIQASTASIADSGALTLIAGLVLGVTTTAANYTVLAADSSVIYTGAGSHTITLVSASTNNGRVIMLKNNGTGAVTIDATGLGQLVPSTGAVNTISLAANEYLIIQAGNSKWQVYSK